VNILSKEEKNTAGNQEAFNRFMFGERHSKIQTDSPPPAEQQPSNIDFTKLMEHSDVLMTTFNELSPYFKKLPSLLSKFTNLIK
jgi:hypothetical protein